jgi:HNH endonuclease
MAKRTCSIPGCGKPHFGHGWCLKHYGRWRRHGDPLHGSRYDGKDWGNTRTQAKKPIAERFWEKVQKTETCWLWQAGRSGNGYGVFYQGRRPFQAHRYAYETLIGPIPDGLPLDHLCRVRHCVRPEHLEPVTPRTNTLRSSIAPAAINAQKTHCKRGHEFTEGNTRVSQRDGERVCRECKRIQSRRSRRAERAN